MKRLFCLAVLYLFTLPAHAADGALALTTEPRDAEIYLDGKLVGTTTPLVLQKIAPGKHTVEAKAGYKSATLEVFVPEDGVVSKKLTLTGESPEVKAAREREAAARAAQADKEKLGKELLAMYQPVRDTFETEAEFEARKEKLRQEINDAVAARDPHFQAGTATLDKSGYDIDSGRFPVTIAWRDWAKGFDLESKGSIQAGRNDARALWDEGAEKAIYVDGDLQVMIVGLHQNWLSDIGVHKISRYIVYPNGTVLDTETKLMWMRCSVGQTWDGKTCQGEAKRFEWEEAKQQTASFAGYSDWRIPSVKELRTLFYCSAGKQTHPDNANELVRCEGGYQFLPIMQEVFPNTPIAWFRYTVYDYNDYGKVYTRPVRGGQ